MTNYEYFIICGFIHYVHNLKFNEVYIYIYKMIITNNIANTEYLVYFQVDNRFRPGGVCYRMV